MALVGAVDRADSGATLIVSAMGQENGCSILHTGELGAGNVSLPVRLFIKWRGRCRIGPRAAVIRIPPRRAVLLAPVRITFEGGRSETVWLVFRLPR